MEQIVKIVSVKNVTHDVLQIVAERPSVLVYKPGQAVEISIDKKGWEQELRPFTFTSLSGDEHIEFIIKTYPSHNGVTNQLLSLKYGDELILHDVFGTIAYKGEGMFIAGGAGITPFIAIFKQLEKENKIGNNKLIFANKTKADIILEDRLNMLLGSNFINVLSDEKREGYEYGFITEKLIKQHLDEHMGYFYLCGPEPMMKAMEEYLSSLGISENAIVKEAF